MYPDMQSRSAQLFERAKAALPGGNSRLTVYYAPYPVYLASGNGARVTDVDGVERLDFVNNMTALIHGHSHPLVVEAVRDAVGELMGVGAPTVREIELAELIASRLASVVQVRFCNSGTEAVMFAVRGARAYLGRPMIARVEGTYHGASDSMETSQVADPDHWGSAERPATLPNSAGIPASSVTDVLTIPYNDTAAALALLEENKHALAGVVIDPYPSRLAFKEAAPDYLLSIRDFCVRNRSVLIFDEVMSFRVAKGGAQGRLNILPDLTALGKIIGGGLPCGAIAGSKEHMSVFDHLSGAPRVVHSGTNNANPVVMAAGLATLKLMTDDLFRHLEALGERFRQGVSEALRASKVPGYIGGVASLSYLSLGDDRRPSNFREAKASHKDVEATAMLHRHLLSDGVLSAEASGFILSGAMTNDDIDSTVEKIYTGLTRLNQREPKRGATA